MATINSVLGLLDTADLGFTLPHEHLIDSTAGIRNTYPELEFRDQALKHGPGVLQPGQKWRR